MWTTTPIFTRILVLPPVGMAGEEALCAPSQGQLLCAEDDKALDHLQRHISHLPAPGQAVEHGIERDFRLQARQGSAQAEMDTTPESDVAY